MSRRPHSSFIPIVCEGGSRVAHFTHFSQREFLASYRFTSFVDVARLHNPAHDRCMTLLGILFRLTTALIITRSCCYAIKR